MKYGFLVLALAALMLNSNVSFASHWVRVGKNNAVSVFVDVESIAPHGNYRKAWVLIDFAEEQGTASSPPKKYRSTKTLDYFNCQEKSATNTRIKFYSGEMGSGRTVDSSSIKLSKAKWHDIVPDSVGEALLRFVCRRVLRTR